MTQTLLKKVDSNQNSFETSNNYSITSYIIIVTIKIRKLQFYVRIFNVIFIKQMSHQFI